MEEGETAFVLSLRKKPRKLGDQGAGQVRGLENRWGKRGKVQKLCIFIAQLQKPITP